MINHPLVILGSARKESDTQKAVELLFKNQAYTLIQLLDFPIEPYRYSHDYSTEDKYFEVIDQVLQHQVIIFATPVYWYAMSGPLKTFFDRITDLVTIRKDAGRKLKGRKIFLLVVAADKEIPPGFITPFELTAAYLQMHFIDYIYSCTKDLNTSFSTSAVTEAFLQKITAHAA